jgi:hypothetical protein
MMAVHDDVHIKLRPGGEWTNSGEGPRKWMSFEGPRTVEEWASVESYMGLFEHCELMLHKELIDVETFTTVYRYRLNNILGNDRIVYAKLIEAERGWPHFIKLLNRVGLAGEFQLARKRALSRVPPWRSAARHLQS